MRKFVYVLSCVTWLSRLARCTGPESCPVQTTPGCGGVREQKDGFLSCWRGRELVCWLVCVVTDLFVFAARGIWKVELQRGGGGGWVLYSGKGIFRLLTSNLVSLNFSGLSTPFWALSTFEVWAHFPSLNFWRSEYNFFPSEHTFFQIWAHILEVLAYLFQVWAFSLVQLHHFQIWAHFLLVCIHLFQKSLSAHFSASSTPFPVVSTLLCVCLCVCVMDVWLQVVNVNQLYYLINAGLLLTLAKPALPFSFQMTLPSLWKMVASGGR